TQVSRSDDGGRTLTQELSKSEVGDVDICVGVPTPCAAITATCIPGKHRVYVSSIEELPLPLQTHLAYSDDRGANWTINNLAAFNPSFIDRPWLGVHPSQVSATPYQVLIAYHDFISNQILVDDAKHRRPR